jgi:hypothetical protein
LPEELQISTPMNFGNLDAINQVVKTDYLRIYTSRALDSSAIQNIYDAENKDGH